jgi:hypothetical protein
MTDDPLGTRDVAIRAITKIEEHIITCERRYEESNQRLERMFAYIKDAHEATGVKIENATKEINTLQTVIATARGAGKMATIMAAAGSGVMGVIGGIGGHFALK